MSRVTNKDAADVLFNVATILELAEDNPYRVRAYRRAARLLLSSRDDVRLKLTPENELDLPGLGPRLRRKLGELLSNGHMRFYVELCADLPGDVSTLMLIPGVGPKTALRLNEELGLTNAADVYAAAQQGKIRQLYGFGPKRERQLLEGAEEVLAGRPKVYAPILPAEEDDLPLDREQEAPRLSVLPPAHEQLSLPEAA
ncbi:MAG TPA: helix-hairpin-helix domain-containing protein [Thermomicrobiales bacterium]|nr:helix-hairpin-helix domain-containing protein [Thermomicrobiales bacterium]